MSLLVGHWMHVGVHLGIESSRKHICLSLKGHIGMRHMVSANLYYTDRTREGGYSGFAGNFSVENRAIFACPHRHADP